MDAERNTTEPATLTPIRRLWVRERFSHGRKQERAARWLDRFEWDATLIARENGRWLSLMGHDASNEGRSVSEAPGLVNGTEVRFSERWLQPTDPTEDYDTVWTISPDGTRIPFTSHLQTDDTPTKTDTDRLAAIAAEQRADAADARGARRRK